MRQRTQILTLTAAAALLLCGCARKQPETTATATPALTDCTLTEVITTTATIATEATSGTTVQTPIDLLEGMLIYSQDFDDFADSTGRSMPALEWDALSENGTASLAIRDHCLYFENLRPQDKRQGDTIRTPANAIPEDLFDYPFTLQYDVTYTAGESGAYAGAADPADAAGLPDASLQNATVTVRLCWEPGAGYTVWQKNAESGTFVKTGDPIPTAHKQIRIFFGAANGYLDNIRVWIGHGDAPDANVLCYWQALAQREGGGA